MEAATQSVTTLLPRASRFPGRQPGRLSSDLAPSQQIPCSSLGCSRIRSAQSGGSLLLPPRLTAQVKLGNHAWIVSRCADRVFLFVKQGSHARGAPEFIYLNIATFGFILMVW